VTELRFQEQSYSWVMVALACVFIGSGFGMLWSFSVFLKPLTTDFGWLRGETSFAYSLAAFLIGVMGILTGTLTRCLSTRTLVLVGASGLACSMALLSKLTALWQLYVFYSLVGLSISALYVPLVANVGFWFDRNKGLAIGLTLGGQLAGAAIIPVVARHLITNIGWSKTYAVLAVIAAMLIPLALAIRQPSAARSNDGHAPTIGAKSSLGRIKDSHLTTVLCCAILCCCIPMSVPLIHAVARAEDAGLAPETASTVLSVMMVAGFCGRVLSGRLADHFGGLKVLMGASALQTMTVFWFALAQTLPSYHILAAVFGLAYGGVMPAYAIILRERLTIDAAAGALGLVYFFAQIGMGLGGWLGGLAFDATGGYILTFFLGIPSGLMNLFIILLLSRYLAWKNRASSSL
jgi:predicted MFS family arabinose efflux permease